MYSLLREEPTGTHYLRVVCGSTFLYEVFLQLTDAEVAAVLPAVAAAQPDALTALARQVMHHGAAGIPGRTYLREDRPVPPQL